MKEHGILFKGEMIRAYIAGQKTQTRRIGDRYSKWKVGDLLWFRETWCLQPRFNAIPTRDIPEDGRWACHRAAYYNSEFGWDPWAGRTKWRPSIFMPRWACRHTAKIISIREERLQDIMPRDAWAEGVKCSCMYPLEQCAGNVIAFKELWDSINGKKPGRSWHDNPRVWRIEFERYQPCGNE